MGSLRSSLDESKRSGGHRDGQISADRAPRMEVLEFQQKWCGYFLALGNKQSVRGTDFLLDNHARYKVFNSALSYFAFFGIRIQGDEGFKKIRTEIFILPRQ